MLIVQPKQASVSLKNWLLHTRKLINDKSP